MTHNVNHLLKRDGVYQIELPRPIRENVTGDQPPDYDTAVNKTNPLILNTRLESEPQFINISVQPNNTVQPTSVTITVSRIPNYTAWSIFNILCCYWLFGAIACWYGVKTDLFQQKSDFESAKKASKSALIWNIIGTICSTIVIIFVDVWWIANSPTHRY